MKVPFENKVVVIGSDHHTTLGAVRSLAEKHVDVYAVLLRGILNFVGSSRYLKNKVYYIDSLEELLPTLAERFPVEEHKTILMCCSDATEHLVDEHYDELSERYLLPSASGKHGTVHQLMDKDYMSSVAEQYGVLVPKTWSVTLADGDQALENITYPCLLKPLKSASGAPVGGTYTVCRDIESLRAARDGYVDAGFVEVLAEEYIDSDIEIGLAGCAFGTEIEPYLPAVCVKQKFFRENNGSTTLGLLDPQYSEYRDMDAVAALLRGIGYSGVFDIELRIKPSGAYLLDANLRVGGCTYVMTKINANLPYIWCHYMATGKLPTYKKIKKNYYHFNEFFYLFDIKRGLIAKRDLLRDLFRHNAFAVWNIRDPRPFFRRILSRRKR